MQDMLKQLLALCKCGVYLTVNEHRDFYETAEEYLTEKEETLGYPWTDIPPAVREKMVATNTIVQVQFYPRTPISAHVILHWDVETAIREARECLSAEAA